MHSVMRKRLLAASVARAAWGAVLVAAPARVLAAGRAPTGAAAVAVARTLGVRQLVQAGVTLLAPAATAGAGAAVDALHAGTAAVLAAVSPRWRRVAVTETLTATAFAAAGRRR